MVPSGMRTPNFQPTVRIIIKVCASQLVRSSGPSTPSVKSFCALIWLSQLIGGVSSEAPIAAFLNESVTSGFAGVPQPELILPSRNAIQRPIPSSRALISATRLRSRSRAAKAGYLRAVNLSTKGKAKRMMENFKREIISYLAAITTRIGGAPRGRLLTSSLAHDYTWRMIAN